MNTDPWSAWQAFRDAARSYLENTAKAATPEAARRLSDLLREQFSAFAPPWGVAREPSTPHTAASNPSNRPFDVPAFGATREHQQRAQRMAEAVQRMEAAQRRLQRLCSDVLREAATHFVAQLRPMEPAAASPDVLRKLYDQWIDCAEDAYARIAHGDAFCQAQAELVNASSQWRREQQAHLEHWSKWLDLPTRSEINSLTHRLRALESQLHAPTDPTPKQSPQPMQSPQPKPSSRPRRSSHKRSPQRAARTKRKT